MLTLSSFFTHIEVVNCAVCFSIFSAHPLILHPVFDLVPSEMVSENDDESDVPLMTARTGELCSACQG